MLTPPLHPKEKLRLNVLRDTDLLADRRERIYEDYVAIAAAIAEAPISLISLIDEHRQWFKAKQGIKVSETPRNVSFCAHAILQDEGNLVVPDAQLDDRFKDNPFVTDGLKVRFYYGMPLRVGGQRMPIGTMCLIDSKPRTLSPDKIAGLEALHRLLEQHINAQIKPNVKPEMDPEG